MVIRVPVAEMRFSTSNLPRNVKMTQPGQNTRPQRPHAHEEKL